MPEPATIAFMTSVYARASDWFIRGEVAQMRALGFTVHTFSIRRPEAVRHRPLGGGISMSRP